MTRTVRVVHGEVHAAHGEPGVTIDTPYNLSFVEDLKDTVPPRERSWQPTEKVWWVSADYADEATELVVFHYGETEVVDEDGCVEYRTAEGAVSRQERLL